MASGSSSNHNHDSPASTLRTQCNICFNQVPVSFITQCTPDIRICKDCLERGRSMENMDISHLFKLQRQGRNVMHCEFFASGCDREGLQSEIERHGTVCGFRDVKCYEPTLQLSPVHWEDCSGVVVPLGMYQRHLNNVHFYAVNRGPSVSIFRNVGIPLQYFGGWKRWPTINIQHEGFGFLWHCYINSPSPGVEGVVYTWVSILAGQGCANKYLYKLEVAMPTNANINWTWNLPVVQFHDFSIPSGYTASIPVGTLKKMFYKEGFGSWGFEMKATISNIVSTPPATASAGSSTGSGGLGLGGSGSSTGGGGLGVGVSGSSSGSGIGSGSGVFKPLTK